MSKSAFPRPGFAYTGEQDGMNLLEFYAGQALPAIVTSSLNSDSLLELPPEAFNRTIANLALNIAEAVVKEVEKRSQ